MLVNNYTIEKYADLRGANLRGADLRNANLRNANLRNADLRNADLHDANLHDANLIGADLIGADLRNANLRNADLTGADLNGADLNGANDIFTAGTNIRGSLFYLWIKNNKFNYIFGCRQYTGFLSAISHYNTPYRGISNKKESIARLVVLAIASGDPEYNENIKY